MINFREGGLRYRPLQTVFCIRGQEHFLTEFLCYALSGILRPRQRVLGGSTKPPEPPGSFLGG